MNAPALRPPLPRFAQIEPVGQCNLRCRMCPVQFRPDGQSGPPAFMAFDTFCSLLDQFTDLAELHLQGLGEPLLHPRFFDMVSRAAARGIVVSTNTNMTVMTADQAQRCVESGLDTLHASIDAADARAYEGVRVGARLPLVLRNLRRLVETRASAGSARPRIVLVAVLMRSTLDGLPSLVRLAADIGVDSMSVQQLCHDFSEDSLPPRYLPMRTFIDGEMLGEADRRHAEAVFAEAHDVAAAAGLPLRLPRLGQRPHGPEVAAREVADPGRARSNGAGPGGAGSGVADPEVAGSEVANLEVADSKVASSEVTSQAVSAPLRCDWPWRGAYISYDGKAMPCCMVATPDRAQLGDMAADGVAAVWHNVAYTDFRARLASPDPPGVCAGCAIYRGTF